MVARLAMLESRHVMNLSSPKIAYDLRPILPLDGEDRIDIIHSGDSVLLRIIYQPAESPREMVCGINFVGVRFFIESPFPGAGVFFCPDDGIVEMLESLVEYDHSDLVEAESEFSGDDELRHYRIFLHSVGVAINVIAEKYEVL